MRKNSCLAAAAALLCWPALPIAAQAPGPASVERPREATFFRVYAADGTAMPGATVTVAGSIPEVDGGATDVVTLVADARGQAIAKLRPDLCYAAWSIGAADAAGAAPFSHLVGYFAAGALVELRCGDAAPLRRVQVDGRGPWEAHGKLTLHLLGWNPATDFELPRDGDAWLLPPTPLREPSHVGVVALEARLDGRPVSWFANLDGAAPLELPPPQRLPVRVVDERGAPIAGARLVQRLGVLPPWRLDGLGAASRSGTVALGTTDAEGRAALEVAYPGDPLREPGSAELQLFAEAPGRERLSGGVRIRAVVENDRKVEKFEGNELRFVARRVSDLEGRIAGMPPGTQAHLQVVARIQTSDRSYAHDPRSWSAPVADDGSFRFEGVPRDALSCRLFFWHPSKAIATPLLQAEGACRLPDLGKLNLVPCEVQVLDARGGPARGGIIQFGPGDRTGTQLRYSVVRLPLDPAGSVRVVLPEGLVAALAVTQSGCVGQLIDHKGAAPVVLRVQPYGRMRVRFLDGNGKPVAGATPVVAGAASRGSSDPVQGMVQGFDAHFRWRMLQLRTDRDGIVELPFLAQEDALIRLALQWEGGRSEDFDLDPDVGETVVRPR